MHEHSKISSFSTVVANRKSFSEHVSCARLSTCVCMYILCVTVILFYFCCICMYIFTYFLLQMLYVWVDTGCMWGEWTGHKRLSNPPPQFSRLGTISLCVGVFVFVRAFVVEGLSSLFIPASMLKTCFLHVCTCLSFRVLVGALYKGSTRVETHLFNNCLCDDFTDSECCLANKLAIHVCILNTCTRIYVVGYTCKEIQF